MMRILQIIREYRELFVEFINNKIIFVKIICRIREEFVLFALYFIISFRTQ
jgi:hypothetical protein